MKPADIEKEDWIPEDAYKVAHDFRNKCASNISKAMMNTLLTDLDKIWRAREKKQLNRLQNQMTREMESLRRALSQKKPYTQALQDQEVKRLKQELKDAQRGLRENVAVIKQESDGPNAGLKLVDTAVKYTNKIQIEKRNLEIENSELKAKLARIQESIKNGETERERFFEGASWAARQSVLACDTGIQKASQLKSQY